MKTTASANTVKKALKNVNKAHGYKLEFNRFDASGTRKIYTNFTLKTKSGIPGARESASGRNLPCASWQAHGFLFDEILRLDPDAIIHSLGKKITRFEGTWIDAI